MTDAVQKKLTEYARRFSRLIGTSCRAVDVQSRSFVDGVFGDGDFYGDHCRYTSCNQLHTHLYGCSEAYRWNGKYIYYCHEGLVFIAASVSDEAGALSGGLVLGPIVMGERDDLLADFEGEPARPLLEGLANLSTRQVGDLAEIMAAVTEYISGVPHSLMGSVAYRQEDILQALYNAPRPERPQPAYPLEKERQLGLAIREGDKAEAQALLNDYLGEIFLITQFDLETTKIRLVELLTVLSRATIEAGADAGEILWFNTGCVRQMQKCRSIDEVGAWITGIMHRFISYTFDFTSAKHSDTVYKVIDYIRKHYAEKITLDGIARSVSFSKTYLSRIFKEETGENVTMYINRVRIEKAKRLLADKSVSLAEVAYRVGFEDQSYFTKVFKTVAGVSPKRYRESREKK